MPTNPQHEYIEERLPPHDVDAEAALLGSLLIDDSAIFDVADMLSVDMFYRYQHRCIYEAITALHARNTPFDLLAVQDELGKAGKLEEAGGMDYLIELLSAVPTSVNAEIYAGIVATKAGRRRLLAAAGSIAKVAYDESGDIGDAYAAAESAVMKARGDTAGGSVLTPTRYATEYIESFMESVTAGKRNDILSTGYPDLDDLLIGLEPPFQYVIAGRPGMGKSAMALSIALHAVSRLNKRVLFFSLEMSERQIMNRLMAAMTGIPLHRIRQPWTLSTQEQTMVMNATGKLSQINLYIDCTPGVKPSDIRARAARAHMEHGLDMVIVDHIGLMRPDTNTGNRVQDLGEITIQLAAVFKELNVIGISLSQLSRKVEERQVKRPILSDLRDSGEIEQNAYAVIFLYREGYYDPTANQHESEAVVAKNRDGATGKAELYWEPETAVYKSAAKVDLNPPAKSNGHANGKVTAQELQQAQDIMI